MARRRKIGGEKERDGGAAAPPVGARLFPRHCERSEAIHLSEQEVTMDCFAALAMTVNMTSHSRGALRPRFAFSFALFEIRGRREDRVHAAPAVSRAIAHRKRAHEHTGSAETLRPSLRNGFTAYFVLFPENGSFASVACASYRTLNASTAAPEPHDFAVRLSRTRQSQLSRPSHLTARS